METSQVISKRIKILELIQQTGNIGDVSKQLYISQPAVTRYIKKLENKSGAILIDRSEHPYHLTAAGLYLLESEKELYKSMIMTRHRLQMLSGQDVQELMIGINASLAVGILPQIIKKFHDKYPGVTLKLDEGLTRDLERKLISGNLDFHISNNYQEKKSIDSLKLFTDNATLVIPKQYTNPLKISSKPITDVSEILNNVPYIRCNSHSGFQIFVDHYLERYQIDPIIRYDNVIMTTAVELVKVGLGAMILPNVMVKHAFRADEDRKNVYFQQINSQLLNYSIRIFWNNRIKLSQVSKEFIQTALNTFKDYQKD